jgi:hypothetical protein
MLSATPCKPVASSFTFSSPGQCSADAKISCSRPLWYDVDAPAEELLEHLQAPLKKKTPILEFPEWLPAFEVCSTSRASTSVGSSPGLEEPSTPAHTPARSPERPRSPQVPAESTKQVSTSEQQANKQCRKVFVGGIPQSIDHNELYKMFNKIAKVKKAWLQMFQADKENQAPANAASKQHRGFGFVVFSDARSVDQLLGEDFSKFINFGDDLKLEVKRAIGKPNASATTPESVREGSTCGTPQEHLGSISLSAALCETRTANAEQNVACPILLAEAVDNTPCVGPMQWQCGGHFAILPCVPPFPFVEASPQIAATVSPERYDVPDVLLDGFLGQKPQSKEELAFVLQQAMPEIYED